MARALRLDAELVRRGLVPSRSSARRAVEQGKVLVGGIPVTKVDAMVGRDAAIALEAPASRFVSRGGEKLDGAMERLDVRVAGRKWLDAGASTGGFTDCLLQRGALQVAAVDVGYGQLDWSLRNDERVVVLERANVRDLDPTRLPFVAEGVTADLSFISLRLVLPALARCATRDADFVLLVKPQFEVGKEAVGKGGVVRDPEEWRRSLKGVVDAARDIDLGLVDAMPSPLRGPAGNVEFFVHLRRDADGPLDAVDRAAAEVEA
ncbi:MAG: TlyA family RNA methyltransferase [Actinomycetota bacterium]|nr:TlyA family RNA methyltransferase [Actinomycetota bacterium]